MFEAGRLLFILSGPNDLGRFLIATATSNKSFDWAGGGMLLKMKDAAQVE